MCFQYTSTTAAATAGNNLSILKLQYAGTLLVLLLEELVIVAISVVIREAVKMKTLYTNEAVKISSEWMICCDSCRKEVRVVCL